MNRVQDSGIELSRLQALDCAAPLDSLADLRKKSLTKLQSQGFPTRKDEAWRYIHLQPLLSERYFLPEKQKLSLSWEDYGIDPTAADIVVMVNGFFQEVISAAGDKPGFQLSSMALLDTHLAQNVAPYFDASSDNAFSLLNNTFFRDGLFLDIPSNLKLKRPIHIAWLSTPASRPRMINQRLIVRMGEGARALIVSDSIGKGEAPSDFINRSQQLLLSGSAELDFYENFRSDAAYQFSFSEAALKKNSVIRWNAVSNQATVSRSDIRLRFEEAGAAAELSSLTLVRGAGRCYQHVTAEHRASHCRSSQLFKTIVAETAQSECNSLVHVIHEAQKTESRQLNRNLILSDAARIYSRPQLKIYSDDVQCSHGSATGQIEAEELFYLRSRGLDAMTAKLLLAYGFAEEVLEKIEPRAFREHIQKSYRNSLQTLFAMERSFNVGP